MDKLDVKLWSLAAKGQIVPDRSLLKTPEQIAAIRKSADLNTAVLDHVAAHIHAGMSTAEIDTLVYDFTTEHEKYLIRDGELVVNMGAYSALVVETIDEMGTGIF